MTQWKAIACLSVLMCGTATAESYEIDGCAELARIVYDEVQSSVLHGPGGAGPWYINPGRGDIHICRTAGKTVSQAFTLALQSTGMSFSWADRLHPGDYCLSGTLSQCYPDRSGLSGADPRLGIVAPIWSTVLRAVMNEMYNPYSSDEVRFRADDLRLQLGLSLRSVRSNPRHVSRGHQE